MELHVQEIRRRCDPLGNLYVVQNTHAPTDCGVEYGVNKEQE